MSQWSRLIFVGEVTTSYSYRRVFCCIAEVRWLSKMIERSQMSQALQYVPEHRNQSNIKYAEEKTCFGDRPPTIMATDESIEDPSVFALKDL